MSREIRRVPLGFAHPLKEVWPGHLLPEALREAPCQPCGQTGYSPFAKRLYDRWYGRVSFDPAETGSEPFTEDTPEVRERAQRNVDRDPLFYGVSDWTAATVPGRGLVSGVELAAERVARPQADEAG